MIKSMLRPLFKRFFGLFVSMVFVSALAITLYISFFSAIDSLKSQYKKYKNDYGEADVILKTDFTAKTKISELLEGVEGIDSHYSRLSIDSYLKKSDGRVITSRTFTLEDNDLGYKVFYKYDTVLHDTLPNVFVEENFAIQNKFKIGDIIKLGYFDTYIDFHIANIVDSPESIFVRASNYITSDTRDFGYLYVPRDTFNDAFIELQEKIKARLDEDPDYAGFYQEVLDTLGIDIPDIASVATDFVLNFSNQILIRKQNGFTQQQVLDNVITKFNESGAITVKESTVGENTPYAIYMANCIKQLTVATLFLPIFFFSVTLVVIILFINQIIKSMTAEIGIMVSMGIANREIVALFSTYTLAMSILASIIGVAGGYGFLHLLINIFISTYHIPVLFPAISIPAIFIATGAIILLGQIAVLVSSFAIFRITPKDAMISNESKKVKIPKPINDFLDKLPMTLRLGFNSIIQNFRRFFVSTFSIFAAFLIVYLALGFSVSKDALINQTTKTRLPFDCQIYLTQKEEGDFLNKLKLESFIGDAEEGYFTFVEMKSAKKSLYVETIAAKPGDDQLLFIPKSSGKGDIAIPDNGLILSSIDASQLKVKKGEYVTINDKQVLVYDISRQYSHSICYMSMAQMDELGVSYVSTYFVNTSDENALLSYLGSNNNNCLTVFTSSLRNDFNVRFGSVNMMIWIIIGFSLLMGFIILSIMTQNALMAQKRQLSIYRSIGFTVLNVSNLWTMQSLSQFIISMVFAVPSGIFFSNLLFTLASSNVQVYPLVLSFGIFALAMGFILLIVVAAHMFAMGTIASWNLADNTRSRE